MLPALFVSHGPPTLPLDDVPVTHFLRSLGSTLGKPKAILCVSAHWPAAVPTLSTATTPETIHDFYGFPPELYAMRYTAPGAPDVAERAADLLREAGFAVALDPERGLDHGCWNPLLLMYPDADVPVLQLALQPDQGPAHHHAVGQALRPLRDEGVLVIGSGNLTHNLMRWRDRAADAPPPDWVTGFQDWMAEAIAERRRDDLLDYRRRAPFAVDNHPSDEHLLPLYVALGAGGATGRRLHASVLRAVLAMDAYAFGE
jgi:4,5-DOPA dioxygenase extradiol